MLQHIKSFIEEYLAVFIAIMTFCWYRRGRLWNFYYTLTDECIQQFKQGKLDSNAWKSIAKRKNATIVSDFFGVLFQFEIEYLRRLISENQMALWVADSSVSVETIAHTEHIIASKRVESVVTDDETYCINEIRKIYFNIFKFAGFWLFVKSFFWYVFKRKKEAGGYTREEIQPLRK